jgi:hypothetical protein
MGLITWLTGRRDGAVFPVTLEGGGKLVRVELPAFVQGVARNARVRMNPDSANSWQLFKTDETDDRYNDQGGIDVGLVRDRESPTEWYALRRRYGKDVPGQSPGTFHCRLGEAHFIVRGGYAKSPDGPGFLVPEWLEYDIYIPDAIAGMSVKMNYTGSRRLFEQGRRSAVDSMVRSLKT